MQFTLLMNNLFDALNRRFPAEGVRLSGNDFQVIEDALQWLDKLEEVVNGKIHKDFFLTPSTEEGLRVTLKSVVQLSNYLLTECGFDYILTAKLNQDRLECFFGTIRQAGGQNEHPTFPTFLQLYRMLSLYTLLKPPKFGNCTVNAKEKRPCITLGDMRLAFQPDEQQTSRLDSLRARLDGLIEEVGNVKMSWSMTTGWQIR